MYFTTSSVLNPNWCGHSLPSIFYIFTMIIKDYPCVVVVGLGNKDIDSDTEMNEEDEKSGNLRQASGGKALLVFTHCK